MLTGKYEELYQSLLPVIDKKRMFHDPLHTLCYGTDASFYRLIPQLVIKTKDEHEVSFILKECAKLGLPATFRAAGTSLSGQAISDSVLIVAGNHWKNYKIDKEGLFITLQPGLTGAKVNSLLAPYGRKIGPDPASINAAMIGGIAANNASGMCCGTSQNSYKTVRSMKVILADGTLLDTADQSSIDLFKKSHASLLEDLEVLVKEVANNAALSERIANKFKMKNTTGYSLNALVDFKDPIEVLQHLMIGSEGTLGFIAEITYETVVEHPFRASSMMIFPDTEKACQAVSLLKTAPVAAVELMDRAGLRSVEDQAGMPSYLKSLSDTACAILVETRSTEKLKLSQQIEEITQRVSTIKAELPIQFTDDAAECALFWKIRKGLFPSIGAIRKTGTTVIIEDVAFPVPRLAEATLDLQAIFKKWNYHEAVIFGHALEGNLHFVFTQDFSTPSEIERYDCFMTDVAELVVKKYDGSLKAEHGTGRNMAPFVELEWRKEAYLLMKRIKSIFDPHALLNPGVIINDKENAHISNLKPLPAAHEKIDKCIECGYCEHTCVSADLTLSPRQRIVALRHLSHLRRTGEQPHIAAAMAKAFQYEANETCATDGLCATACPVKIDTGKMIKELRAAQIGEHSKGALLIANNMDKLTAAARLGLNCVGFAQKLFGNSAMQLLANGMRKISGGAIPQWSRYMPHGSKAIDTQRERLKSDRKVVYFPSCINRAMGTSAEHRHEKQLSEKMVELIEKAGYEVIYPENMNNHCCGMAFLSKGYLEAGHKKSDELEAALLKASENGKYPVLCDMSPCLFTMKENMKSGLKLMEPVELILDYLLPHLEIRPVEETVSVFAVCSMKKMGLEGRLTELASLCASKVVVADTNCCGFAGDRGFSFPELNQHGLRYLKSQLPAEVKRGFSTSRTCEIGMSLHSGVSHQSIVYLVDQVTRAKGE